jgi:hypothetical protein
MILALFPILFLLTSIGSLLIYQRSQSDHFRLLAVVMAMVAIVWLLTISHWSFQILCLLLLLFYDWGSDRAKIATAGETIVDRQAKKKLLTN